MDLKACVFFYAALQSSATRFSVINVLDLDDHSQTSIADKCALRKEAYGDESCEAISLLTALTHDVVEARTLSCRGIA